MPATLGCGSWSLAATELGSAAGLATVVGSMTTELTLAAGVFSMVTVMPLGANHADCISATGVVHGFGRGWRGEGGWWWWYWW